MILILNLLIIGAISYWVWYRNRLQPLRHFYWPAIVLKVLSGLALGWLYLEYLNGGDTWSMFNAAVGIRDLIAQSPGEFVNIFFLNDYSKLSGFSYTWIPTAFMVKSLAVLCFLSNSNYWIIAVYLSLFSFFGFWSFAKTLYRLTSNFWVAIIPTLFFPSIVFWTSGVLKEALAIGSLAWLLSLLLSFYINKKTSKLALLAVVFHFTLLAILKYYLAAILLVAVLTLIIGGKITRYIQTERLEFLRYLLLFITILLASSLLHPNLWPNRFLAVIYDNYQEFVMMSDLSSIIHFDELQPNFISFTMYSPKALFGGLFMPLWLSDISLLKVIVLIENWFLLLITTVAIFNFKLPSPSLRPILYTSIFYIITAAIFITFSTPNYGTLVRYKVGYLLIFLPVLLILVLSKTKRAN